MARQLWPSLFSKQARSVPANHSSKSMPIPALLGALTGWDAAQHFAEGGCQRVIVGKLLSEETTCAIALG